MNDIIHQAIKKGGLIFPSISGGKDGQAMVKAIVNNGYSISGLIHADLGSVEWPESLPQCEKQSADLGIPLHVVRRRDGKGLLELWRSRMEKLKGSGKPFWSSSKNRYCTSDTKRDVIDTFFRSLESNLIISCEGIRAQESTDRSKKPVLEIRRRISSSYYKGMTVEEAIANYRPDKRLALTWFPIFNWLLDEVWASYGNTAEQLAAFRIEYKETGVVNADWQFHPAYVYGNDRVSCMFCIMGKLSDLQNAAEHNPQLLQEMIEMEDEGEATFKQNWSLKELL